MLTEEQEKQIVLAVMRGAAERGDGVTGGELAQALRWAAGIVIDSQLFTLACNGMLDLWFEEGRDEPLVRLNDDGVTFARDLIETLGMDGEAT